MKLGDALTAVFGSYKRSWKSLLADLGFFFSLGFVLGLLQIRDLIGNNLLHLGDLMVQQSGALGQSLFSIILHSSYFTRILQLVGIGALALYPLYGLFHGFLWRFSANLLGKKGSYAEYLKKFFLVNALWMPLFTGYVLLNFVFSYFDTVVQRTQPDAFPLMATISNVFFFILLYFAFLSYVFLLKEDVRRSIRKAFSFGVRLRKSWEALAALAIAGIVLKLIGMTGRLSLNWMIVLSFIVTPVLLLWLRMVFQKVAA